MVVLKACLNFYFKTIPETDELIIQIPISLIQLLNKVPLNYQSYIVECFRTMNSISCHYKSEILHSFQSSVVPVLVGCIKEQQNTLSNMFILRLFYKCFFLEENENSRLNDFFQAALFELVPVFICIFQCPEINDLTADLTKNIIKLLLSTINNATSNGYFIFMDMFNSSAICSVIPSLSRYFQTDYQCSLSLNRNILKFFKSLCCIFYKDTVFEANCISFIFNIIIQILPKATDMFIRQHSLGIIISMHSSHYFDNEIHTPDFLENILIPSAKLSLEDISNMLESPSRTSYYFSFSRYSKRKIIQTMANFLLDDPNLFSAIMSQPPNDQIDFESRIFILSCANHRESNEQKRYIESVVNCAMNITSNPPFLQASFLYFLARFVDSPYSDPQILMKIGFQCIIASNEPVVILAASKLLLCDSLKFSDYFKLISSDQCEEASIVPKLLSLCVSINVVKPLDLIMKYVEQSSNCSPCFIFTLIEHMFSNCHEIVAQPGDITTSADALEYTLNSILNIFESLYYSCQNDMEETVDYCINQSTEIYNRTSCDKHRHSILDFIGYFNYKLTNPRDLQFGFVMMAISSENMSSDLFLVLLGIVYPLIMNPNSNITCRQPFVETIAKVCNNFIQKIIEGEFNATSCELDSLLKVCGGLIEIFGSDFVGFAQLPFFLLHGESWQINDHYPSSIYVIYNVMRANIQLALTLFDDVVLEVLLNNSIASTHSGDFYKNEVKAHFLILLMLAQGKTAASELCFRAAIRFSKNFLGVNEISMDFSSIPRMLRCFPTALDTVNEWEFFSQVANETGFALSDTEQKTIENVLKQNQ